MKRLHVHISVDDLERSIGFYSALFAANPTVHKPDYAKWMLEDPRVNFAISQRVGVLAGLDHLGIQAETEGELEAVQERLTHADGPVLDEGDVTCCYARSRKSWIADPSGISWETFLSLGESAVYSDGEHKDAPLARQQDEAVEGACCAPQAMETALAGQSACCGPGAAASTESTSAKACC